MKGECETSHGAIWRFISTGYARCDRPVTLL
jgi:hypothetical protein